MFELFALAVAVVALIVAVKAFNQVSLLRARLGSDSAIIYNLRDVRDKERLRTEGPLAELHERFGQTSTWTMEQGGEVVDVENLINWFLSVVFCGTRDIAQGTLVHDPARAGAQWFWIGWDYDMSFGRRILTGARSSCATSSGQVRRSGSASPGASWWRVTRS